MVIGNENISRLIPMEKIDMELTNILYKMITDYGPAMIEHIILKADLDPTLKAATEFDSSLGRHNRRK